MISRASEARKQDNSNINNNFSDFINRLEKLEVGGTNGRVSQEATRLSSEGARKDHPRALCSGILASMKP